MTLGLRVIHAALSLRESYGGPARSIPALADALAGLGTGVELVTADNATADDPLVRPRHPAVQLTTVPGVLDAKGLALWMPRFRRAVAERIAAGVPPILHDHGMWRATNRAMAAVARSARLPLLVSPRGMLQPWARTHRGARKRVAWALYARHDLMQARALHATSLEEARTLSDLGLRLPVVHIPNGVDLPPLVQAPDPARASRQLLFLGRIAPIKGLTTLVDAWALARPAGWSLVLAGPDEDGYADTIRRAINEARLGDTVTLRGSVSEADKWALLAASDAVVLPSHSESFGVAIAEGLAAGRPAIATTGTPWRALAEARCGWWVAPTPPALAEAIRALTSATDVERATMGGAARAYAERELSWERAAAAMTDVYSWLARGGAAPAALVRP